MKKSAVLLVIAALLILGCQPQNESALPAAGSKVASTVVISEFGPGNFQKVVIPDANVCSFIQPLKYSEKEGWEQPNHETAWWLEFWPQAIFLHRGTLGANLNQLVSGDIVYLYQDAVKESKPLQLQVTRLEVINAIDEENMVLEKTGGEVFALLTCHPPDDETAPQLLVVWLKVDHGVQWCYIDWGETLEQIAQRYKVAPEAIAQLNNITDVNPQQWIKIPTK